MCSNKTSVASRMRLFIFTLPFIFFIFLQSVESNPLPGWLRGRKSKNKYKRIAPESIEESLLKPKSLKPVVLNNGDEVFRRGKLKAIVWNGLVYTSFSTKLIYSEKPKHRDILKTKDGVEKAEYDEHKGWIGFL
ncbi:uncharacterized protein LOC117174415 [Belonocnema kinseyi]|uniref:uncharacterized protein LOC117174415 n=1 Tax=Belonocnema kinseyi TaxID=2817044 RepID=UPI00143D0283|nr:uncharacterized protein LOC117174415 [Belonocnema kinseyi]